MAEEKENIPKDAIYTLSVPLDKDKKKIATFHIKDIDEDVFMAAKSLFDKDKEFDAVRLVVKALWVGGDSPDLLKGNLVAVSSAANLVAQLIKPVEGEIKKN